MKPATIADRMGELRARMAELKEQEESLRKEALKTGLEEIEGRRFRLLVLNVEVTMVDYKGLVEEMKPNKRLLRKFTHEEERTQVRVTART